MAVRKIRDRWWVDIRYNFVRYRKKSPLDSKAGAQAHETYLRGELAKHGDLEQLAPKPPAPKPVTFAEFAERWMREYVAVNNKWSEQRNKDQVLRAYLVPTFGTTALNDITSASVERFKSACTRKNRGRSAPPGLNPKTTNNILTVLRKCLVTAVEWGELDHLPIVRPLKTGPAPFRYLSTTEAQRLVATCPEGPWRAMVLVGLDTGLRYSELAGLRWEDVDAERRTLCVVRAKVLGRVGPPKNFRSRVVPLTSEALSQLSALPKTTEWVFGHVTTYWQAQRPLARFSEVAGLGRVGWHDLRHTFASRLVAAGAPLKAVQDLLGHSTITMTLQYVHLGRQEVRNAIDLLEPEKMGNPWSTQRQIQPDEGLRLPAERQNTAISAVF